MSGAGTPGIQVQGFTGKKVVIVAASWHTEIMDSLIQNAVAVVREVGIEPQLVRVPGSFEIPVVALHAAQNGADAVVALGVVIRGGTPHFEYICDAVTEGLNRVALDTGVPVGNGVLTCDTEQQALDRSGRPGSLENKGGEAAAAALNTWVAIQEVKNA